MPAFIRKQAYRLECRNPTCSWEQSYYFDEQLPQKCQNPRCNRPMPKVHTLQTGPGYDHAKHRKSIIDTLVRLGDDKEVR